MENSVEPYESSLRVQIMPGILQAALVVGGTSFIFGLVGWFGRQRPNSLLRLAGMTLLLWAISGFAYGLTLLFRWIAAP
ncbi:MAG: hypothetical protein M5U01_02215 [Ardenticatenaceae bacterium]|nr:hypothetical protein [Ardenticatenaceae bacterium]